MDKVRLALIGTGGISGAHAEGLLAHKDQIECVALCDVSPDNLKKRSDQLGGVAAQFHDWKKMLAEMGGKIDAVDICLPHHLHAPAILDAARAGKHILCEKPMCINLEEADTIVAAVEKAGVTYMSAHNQLFLPAVQKAKELLDSGKIGRLIWLRSQDCFVPGPNAFAGKWRAELKYQGGGELIDTGYHPSYRLMYLAGGEIEAVRSTMGRFRHAIEGEDTASVQVRFSNGVIGEILTSWAIPLPYGTHQIHLIGDKGQIFGSGNTLYYLPEGFQEPAKITLPESGSSFVAQMGHFADCIRNKKRPIHSEAEGRAVLQIILNASKNAEGWQAAAPVPK
jgi:predicted dehydrogenase